MTPPVRLWYLLYMRVNLETTPKYRITFTRNSPADDPAPDNLGLERQPDGGWHLWSELEAFAGVLIPAESVEHLITILCRSGIGSRSVSSPVLPAPDPILAQADGRNQRTPTIEPDPGYRIVVPGERIQSCDLWKYSDGTGCPVDFTVGQILAPGNSAILQRLDPDAVAPGHNPDRLTVAEVGIADGWRLLTEEEAKEFAHNKVAPTEYRSSTPDRWVEADCIWGVSSASTLRTKAEKLEVVS